MEEEPYRTSSALYKEEEPYRTSSDLYMLANDVQDYMNEIIDKRAATIAADQNRYDANQNIQSIRLLPAVRPLIEAGMSRDHILQNVQPHVRDLILALEEMADRNKRQEIAIRRELRPGGRLNIFRSF